MHVNVKTFSMAVRNVNLKNNSGSPIEFNLSDKLRVKNFLKFKFS